MSICIVHRDGWAVADSRESVGHLIVPSTSSKVVKAEGFLIACAGNSAVNQKVRKIVKEHGHEVTILEIISDAFVEKEQEGNLLAVSYKRQLIDIDDCGSMSELDSVDFWAIGSISQFVLGRLFYIAETRPITIEDAEAAIKAAAVFHTSIDARVQKFYLEQ